jgi:enolase
MELNEAEIENVRAREIINSEGIPTIEVDILIQLEIYRSACPSLLEPQDLEKSQLERIHTAKCNVNDALNWVNNDVLSRLKGFRINQQEVIDQTIKDAYSSTKLSSILVKRVSVAISVAVARAAAARINLPLFRYFASLAGVNRLILPLIAYSVARRDLYPEYAIEDYLIIPTQVSSIIEANSIAIQVFAATAEQYKQYLCKKCGTGIFSQKDPVACYDMVLESIRSLGLNTETVKIGLDIGGKHMIDPERNLYHLCRHKSEKSMDEGDQEICYHDEFLNTDEMINCFYQHLIERAEPRTIKFMLDAFHPNDCKGFVKLTSRYGEQDMSIFCTHLSESFEKMNEAIGVNAINGILLNPAHFGTISDSINAYKLARENNLKILVFQTDKADLADEYLADFAVGLSADYFKAGPPLHSEHLAKYNRMIRIEEYLEENTCPTCGSMECGCTKDNCLCSKRSDRQPECNYGKRYKVRCGNKATEK